MKIKVGHLDYTVVGLSPIAADAESALGMHMESTQKIYVRSDLGPQVQASVLIHEVLHACFNAFGIPREGLSEEDVCTHLERPLANVFRDNPKLAKSLHEALNDGKAIVRAER